MKKKDIIPYLDHTNLSPIATEADIYEFAKNAVGTGVASLCIQPCYISFINREFANLFKLCTVVGFPNGYDAPEIKVKAVEKALEDGANEIDYVVHLGKIKNRTFSALQKDVEMALSVLSDDAIFKVILETGALDRQEIIETIQHLNELPIHFYKTSTGFGFPGATVESAKLILQYKREDISLKVSGGIRTIDAALEYIELGASRIGSSKLLPLCLDSSL